MFHDQLNSAKIFFRVWKTRDMDMQMCIVWLSLYQSDILNSGISHELLELFQSTHESFNRRVGLPRKYNWEIGFSMWYAMSVEQRFRYTMPFNWNQHIGAAHDGNVGYHTDEYTTAFMYSDWLYFLWHGINSLHSSSLYFLNSPAEPECCFLLKKVSRVTKLNFGTYFLHFVVLLPR